MNLKYPIYIISKGRHESRLTSKTLEYMNLPYNIVIEPQEYDDYASVISPDKILVLPFSNLGQGSIPARNWCWEHSILGGHKRHWLMDDNIHLFFRLNKNMKIPVADGTIFKCMEDFTDRYKDVAFSGPNYFMFASRKSGSIKPYLTNTRVYSCTLIKNDLPYRWRGKYNEDTDICLRALKDDYRTILFSAFLQGKATTMTLKGGNTDEVYVDGDNRLKFAQSLKEQHPDLVEITNKFGRFHHQVNYKPFKKNNLIRKEGITIKEGINNYGMELINIEEIETVKIEEDIIKSKTPIILFWSSFNEETIIEEWLSSNIKITALHNLSLLSLLKYNENVHLYSYHKSLKNKVPKEIKVFNADYIYSSKDAFEALKKGHSIAHISDLVRLNRAIDNEGIVLDMDAVCLRPFKDSIGFTSSMYGKLTGGMALKFRENNPALTVNDNSWDGKALSMFPLKVCESMTKNVKEITEKIKFKLSLDPKKDTAGWNYVMWDLKKLPKLDNNIKTYEPLIHCPLPAWLGAGKCYSLESPTRMNGTTELFGNTMPSIEDILNKSVVVQHFFESTFDDSKLTGDGFWENVKEDCLLAKEAEHVLGKDWKIKLIDLSK